MEYIAQLIDLTVNADLSKIIKYHPASKIYLDVDKPEYKTSFQVKMLLMEVNGELTPHPDYIYSKIVDKTGINPSHENTLLVLVKNMIEIEWGYYASYFSKDDHGKLLINQHTEIKDLLHDLKVLKIQKENNTIVETKLTQKEYGSLPSQDPKRLYNSDGMQVDVSSRIENLQIIDLLFNNRIEALKDPVYPIFHYSSTPIEEWSIEQIEEAIDYVSQPFKDYRALWLFGKFVTETVLAYLKGEIEWNQGDTEITEKQGVFIYTLLLLFHLLKPDEELKFKSDRDKAKYVRSFLRKDTKDNKEQFFKFKHGLD